MANDAQDRAVTIDPDYARRAGYDRDFLLTGEGPFAVNLPALAPELVPDVAEFDDGSGTPTCVLRYHHFSMVMHKARRIALYTAVNVDGSRFAKLKRESDKWSFDPRLPREWQLGADFYRDNDLDLGHMVRRLDPCWGDTEAEAKLCADDTFHFTNASPQHKDFNRDKTVWAGVENYLLDHAIAERLRISVFSGPVLDAADPPFNQVRLPLQYWKVVVMLKRDGAPSATAYLLDQTSVVQAMLSREFVFGKYRTYQVPVAHVEALSRLSYGALSEHDPLRPERGLPRELDSFDGIRV